MLRSKTQKELLKLSKQLIQPLLPSYHKGQAGKVVVIGGCEDYTGAPFFACHSAAMVGSDMNHIICERTASTVIKSYSADLMVHPYMYELSSPEIKSLVSEKDIEKFASKDIEEVIHDDSSAISQMINDKIIPKISQLLTRVDIVVVGPGLGRDPLMLKTLVRIIEEVKVLNKPVILDADALYLLCIDPNLVKNYSKAFLTPNVAEFGRLANKLDITEKKEATQDDDVNATIAMSKALGNVTIIRKGQKEIIVKNDEYLINDLEGSAKRVGGQGDTLTGALATLLNWSNHYSNGFWDINGKLTNEESELLACFAACSLVRIASYKAFQKFGRSMQTSNVHQYLSDAYNELYENDEFVKL